MFMKKPLLKICCFSVALLVLCASDVFASNGSKILGSGAIAPVLGGTGCVEPQDTAAMMINPAGITKIGNRVDIGNELAFIDLRLDTSAVAAPYGNSIGVQSNRAHHAVIPYFGVATQLKDSPIYVGCAVGLVSGFAVDFEHSRLATSTTQDAYDRRAELYQIEFTPTVAYTYDEHVSIGATLVGTFNRLETDTAKGFAVNSGRDNGSHAWGLGFNVGAIYDVNEYISVGASYKSMRWNQEFNEYSNLAYRLNGAPETIFGIAIKPHAKLLFEHNTKFIHWRAVDLLRKSPEKGGYGWEDQWVFGFGLQYTPVERLRVRAGYNYGQSPIHPDAVYANALAALISEHHLTLGFGFDLTDSITIDAGWLHAFRNRMVENGQGDAKSRIGTGTKVSLEVDSIYIGLSYRFD
jgi:long-chain fatty acid transport protein